MQRLQFDRILEQAASFQRISEPQLDFACVVKDTGFANANLQSQIHLFLGLSVSPAFAKSPCVCVEGMHIAPDSDFLLRDG
jgi:hypothetical protein